MKKERNRMKKAQSRKREPFRIYRASITVEAALLYPILIFLLMFLLQKTITYYQQTDQAAQGIISVEEPDTSKMFWKIVLAQRVTEEIKEIVILFFFQGLKQKEIADLLNIKLSLVKYRVSKAKELLAKQLEVEKL